MCERMVRKGIRRCGVGGNGWILAEYGDWGTGGAPPTPGSQCETCSDGFLARTASLALDLPSRAIRFVPAIVMVPRVPRAINECVDLADYDAEATARMCPARG